jgi:cystathionine beta-lyase
MFGSDDLLPMWVADMDFPCPQPVVDAIKRRAEHPIYGYTFPPESLYEAIVDRVERHFGWKIKKEWIVFSANVVDAVYASLRAFAIPGDEVVIQPPVYTPFFAAINNTGCQVLQNPLKFDGERYDMDFDGLENLFRPVTTFPGRSPRIRAMVLCNPHNPVGRVWSPEELKRLGSILMQHNCMLISDEIHADLHLKNVKHTVTASLSAEMEQHTITLMSGTKSFNLAGLSTAFAIIPNDEWRAKIMLAQAGTGGTNVFGLAALEAAFRDCDDYLDQLRDYLEENRRFFSEYIEQHIPGMKIIKAQGTYLAWVNMRGLGLSTEELERFIRQKARLAFDDGYAFGPGGEGFMRINLACPRSVLKEALERLETAVRDLR